MCNCNEQLSVPRFNHRKIIDSPTITEMTNQMSTNSPGLVIFATDSIRLFLSGAVKDPNLTEEFRKTASDLVRQSNVPYAPLRGIWMASDPSVRPDLMRLFAGTQFLFTSPKPREKVNFSVCLVLFAYDY